MSHPEPEDELDRMDDRELIAEIRRHMEHVASAIGKEPWATQQMLDDIGSSLEAFENAVDISERADEELRIATEQVNASAEALLLTIPEKHSKPILTGTLWKRPKTTGN
jgi:hypothetical protein